MEGFSSLRCLPDGVGGAWSSIPVSVQPLVESLGHLVSFSCASDSSSGSRLPVPLFAEESLAPQKQLLLCLICSFLVSPWYPQSRGAMPKYELDFAVVS